MSGRLASRALLCAPECYVESAPQVLAFSAISLEKLCIVFHHEPPRRPSGSPPFSSRRPIMEHGTISSHASQLEQLVLDALQDMQRLGYSPSRLKVYKAVFEPKVTQ